MRRKILSLHLLLAAFMAPAFIMIAVSGGLYLLEFKGSVSETPINVREQLTLDLDRDPNALEADVRTLIERLDLGIDFEYLKMGEATLTTRPTSREHLRISVVEDGLEIIKIKPDLQSALMELHKGHGPTFYKTYQKWVALGLIFVLLSGLWMGLSNKMMRQKTVVASVLGLLTFIVLVLF